MVDAEPMRSPLTTPTGAAAETRLHTAGAASAPSVSDRELPDYRLRFILLLLADGAHQISYLKHNRFFFSDHS
ncbi:MAG TPA: hypothetical protein PLG75_11955, partial [Methanoculleus sp.]|nr:hypothetical protein [Methanoculleus sp.]